MEQEFPKMDTELKTKWLNALRSGEYKQGNSALYDPKTNSFCCLGVLENICGTPVYEMHNNSDDDDGYYMIWFPSDLETPRSPDIFCGNGNKDLPRTLAKMNDGNKPEGIPKHNFLEIADWIETSL